MIMVFLFYMRQETVRFPKNIILLVSWLAPPLFFFFFKLINLLFIIFKVYNVRLVHQISGIIHRLAQCMGKFDVIFFFAR